MSLSNHICVSVITQNIITEELRIHRSTGTVVVHFKLANSSKPSYDSESFESVDDRTGKRSPD